jgi:predicted AAA+ superfamily ATPase
MWIYRDISKILTENNDVIQVIRGPRQVGKSSLCLHLEPNVRELSLDDSRLRSLAMSDPELFLKQFDGSPLFIDEAQYAPQLFPALKRKADLYKRATSGKLKTIIRLTGSNQILMDKNVKESLVGRAAYFDLNSLSVAEILNWKSDFSIQSIMYRGGWPELYAREIENPNRFLDDYINTYVEKDILLTAGIQKSNEFFKFLHLLAGRVGQLLDFASLGADVGVDAKSIKSWISVLEKMKIIALVQPFYSNLSKRLIKSPKVYFIDTGIACRLQGWSSAEPIMTSPQQGQLFENLVFSEIYKLNQNYGCGWEIFHWRSRDGEEIDFVIKMGNQRYLMIESKVSAQKIPSTGNYPEIKKVFGNELPQVLLCHQEGEQVLGSQVPIRFLKEVLLKWEHLSGHI